MVYACELGNGQHLYLDNVNLQTIVTLDSSSAGRQQQSSQTMQTGEWTAPPEVFRMTHGVVVKLSTLRGEQFIDIQSSRVSVLNQSPGLGNAQRLPLQQIPLQQIPSSGLPPMQPMRPMKPMEPMKMGDMQMSMNPMTMRMGNMSLQMGTSQVGTSATGQSDASPATRRFCSQCGQSTQPSDRFCSSCGHPLTS